MAISTVIHIWIDHLINTGFMKGRLIISILKEVFRIFVILIITVLILYGCAADNSSDFLCISKEPFIEPDYSGVTIPANIAQLNFRILEDGKKYTVNCYSQDGQLRFKIKSKNGIVRFPSGSWSKLLNENRGKDVNFEVIAKDEKGLYKKYNPFVIHISDETIDPYICYRMLYPGYESWAEMQIVQRSLEDFSEKVIFDNRIMDNNCVNCHTFFKYDPAKFFLHVRGSVKGSYFIDGKDVTRRILRTDNMISNAVYPAWHPDGRFIVFSSNGVVQSFNMIPGEKTEVYDQFSAFVIYDSDINTISEIYTKDTTKYIETFPCWSPGGDYLYYCRSQQLKDRSDYWRIKYDLVRKPFDNSTGIFGEAEIIFKAQDIDKSVSMPSISPDGNYLIFTLHDYGTFSIWHKEADLYLLDLINGKTDSMVVNSNESESHNTWSSNGKWIMFSSKRIDGVTARPYFAWFGSPDNVGKPFVLPQKDPSLYERLIKTFNRPEFVTGKIITGPRDFAHASKSDPAYAIWSDKPGNRND